MRHFMSEVEAEEMLALWEEIKGKLLNIPFIYNQKKDTVKRILTKVSTNAVVKQGFEQ